MLFTFTDLRQYVQVIEIQWFNSGQYFAAPSAIVERMVLGLCKIVEEIKIPIVAEHCQIPNADTAVLILLGKLAIRSRKPERVTSAFGSQEFHVELVLLLFRHEGVCVCPKLR